MRSRALEIGTAAALAVTLGLTGCAAAEGQGEDIQPEEREGNDRELRGLPAFRALDGDDDGVVSAGEIDAAPESLASLDDDGDGRLTGDELRPRRGVSLIGGPADPATALPRIPEGARVITLAADGELDMADLPPGIRSRLSPADADGDGVASAADILALMMAEAGEPGDELQGTAEGRAAPSPGGGSLRVDMPLMTALDKDRDGLVSEREIESAAQSLRGLDTDGDGRLTPDELRPAAGSDPSLGGRQE